MDIVIYTTRKKLSHKKGEDGGYSCYWFLYRAPKNFKVGNRIYFAVKGKVVGSFKCDEFNPEHDKRDEPKTEETVVWTCDTWEEIEEPIPTKHFQGFKYKWW